MSDQDNIKKLINNKQRRLQKLKERESVEGISVDPKVLIEIEDIEAELSRLERKLKSHEVEAINPISSKEAVTQEKSPKQTTAKKSLLTAFRDPIWQMIGVIIAILALVWSIYALSVSPTPSPSFTPSSILPSGTPQAPTPDVQISPTLKTSDIYIADWSGPHSTLSKKLLVNQQSCKSEQGFARTLLVGSPPYSMSLGSAPTLKYYVILETWIALTFVNSNSIPNGIIRIEPIYNTDYERQWQLDVWYVTMYHPDDLKKAIVPPIELPPNTPVKRYFRAIHVVEVDPNIFAGAVYKYADEDLSPLRWTFTTLGDSQIIHISELEQYAPEALDDGKFKFKGNCSDILPEWPVPIPGRALNRGK